MHRSNRKVLCGKIASAVIAGVIWRSFSQYSNESNQYERYEWVTVFGVIHSMEGMGGVIHSMEGIGGVE